MHTATSSGFVFAQPIVTGRLLLIPATRDHVEAELRGNPAFGDLLGAVVPVSWPPGQYDRDAQQYFLDSLSAAGDAGIGWFGWYAVLRAAHATASTLVGCGGYFGPPSPEGVVEIGYSICPEWQGNGYASELSRALIEHVIQDERVARVIAHTHATNRASIRVLMNSGFAQQQTSDTPDALLFEWVPAVAGK